MLLGDVRVVPDDFLLEPPRRGVVVDPGDLRANDAFESVKHRAGSNALDRIGPVRSLAEVDRVMVSVGVPKPNRHASGRCESKGIDQLFPQQSHGCRTQDDDTLLMQPDDPFIRAEVQQFREMRICWGRLVIATWLRLHGSAIVRRERRSNVASRTPRATSRMGSPMSARIRDGGSLAVNESTRTSSIACSGGKTGLCIAGFINDPADSYDG